VCDKFVGRCDVRNAGKVEREFLCAFQRAQSTRSPCRDGEKDYSGQEVMQALCA